MNIETDRGSATVLALLAVAAIMTIMTGVVLAGSLAMARGRASMIADLAALAAARSSSCDAAARLVESAAAQMTRCEASLTDVSVEVGVALQPPLRHAWPIDLVRVTSRAGF